MFLSTVLFIIWSISILKTDAEMYSSMQKLEDALKRYRNHEFELKRRLEYSLKLGILTVASAPHRTEIERNFKRLEAIESFENPVAVFDWLYHMQNVRNWLTIEQYGRYFSSEWNFIPTDEDVEGAADGILRLQWLHKLSAAQIIHGDIKNLTKMSPNCLTSQQIDFLAERALEKSSAKMASQWIIEAVKHKDGRRKTFFDRKTIKMNTEWVPLTKKLRLMFANSVQKVDDLRIWESFLSLCLNFEEFELAIGAAQTIQLLHGYHYSAVLPNKKKWIPDVDKKCLKMTSLEEKVEAMDYQLDYLSEMVNGDLDYCLDDVEEFKEGEPIIRSGMCRWSVPSPFYTIGPLKEEILSEDPEIKLWHDFVHDSEIQRILEHSIGTLQRSQQSKEEFQKGVISQPDTLYLQLNERLQSATGLIVNDDTSEHYQCSNYGVGGLSSSQQEDADADFIHNTAPQHLRKCLKSGAGSAGFV